MLNASPKDDIRVPGPSKRLMREVRRYLKARGIVPVNPIWRQAWAWAKAIADSYWSAKSSRYYYPSPREVSTQYIVLLLTSMKTDGDYVRTD